MKCYPSQCQLVVASLAVAALVMLLSSQPIVAATIDYSQSLAADFKTTFPGDDPGAAPPLNNPFGDWELRGPNGLASEMTPAGGLPASGQFGWCTGSAGVCDGSPLYTYFGTKWQPGITIDPRVAGHGPHDVLWTAPANVDAGGVELRGSIEQLFEQSRVQRISVFKNGGANPIFVIDSLPPVVDGIVLQRVDFGPRTIPVVPGDTLNFILDGSGAGGSGAETFSAWDVTLSEVPEPASAIILGLGLGFLITARCRKCSWI